LEFGEAGVVAGYLSSQANFTTRRAGSIMETVVNLTSLEGKSIK
jgi:hypothetical protein